MTKAFKSNTKRCYHHILFLILAGFIYCTDIFSQGSQQLPDIYVAHPPEIVMINGKPTVWYELYVNNVGQDSIALKSIEVFALPDSSLVHTFNHDEIVKRFDFIDKNEGVTRGMLLPKSLGVIYLEVPLLSNSQSIRIYHRVYFDIINRNGKKQLFVQSGLRDAIQKSQLNLGPPLRQGNWAAVYEASWPRGHRRVIYTVNNKRYIPGRFAIDFIRLDEQGRYCSGEENVIKNWYAYANDVLAVADGVVASTRNDFEESKTLSDHPGYPPEKATGNYISIDIGNNCFVFYEHLQPSSIRVTPGQRVKKGDVIASLGFTGQSTGPHLHIHVANFNSPLGAEGIPFAFEHFTLLGVYDNFDDFGKSPWKPVTNTRDHHNERPPANSVIKF